jgi:hypothetical protein
VTATDVDGDVGTGEFTFETAPLPPTVSINGLPAGIISEPVTLNIEVTSQTPVSSVSSTLGQLNLDVVEGEDVFEITVDPLAFPPGDYDLTVTVSNEGGASAEVTAQISIAQVAPRNIRVEGVEAGIGESTSLVVAADTQEGSEIASVTVSANGQLLENNTIDPINFPAGELPLEITVTDNNGQTTTETVTVTINAVAPRLEIGEIAAPVGEEAIVPVTVQSQGTVATVYSVDGGSEIELEGDAITLDGTALGNGEHTLTVTVTDENGESTTETVTFTVELPPTATPTPDLTQTADAEANARSTADALTAVAGTEGALQATLNANATRVFQDEATRNAQATRDTEPTEEASEATEEETAALLAPTDVPTEAPTDTNEPTLEPTDEPTVVPTEAPTDTDEPTVVPTDEPTDTPTDEPTLVPTEAPTDTAIVEATLTPSVAPSLTPIGEIIEVDAQSADAPQGNLTILMMICGGALILGILLAIVFFGRQRRSS